MPPHIGLSAATGGLQGVADSTTSTAIALLSLAAVVVLGYGLIRAIVMNRRTQIVMADLTVPGGAADLAEVILLSSAVRQCVERHVNDQREQTARVGETILSSASRELEPQLDARAVERIQRAANDSIATLSAALRAVSPDTADRFLGLFSAILPPPRGLSVTVALLHRGTAAVPRLGAAVEVVRLDGRSLATAVFWEAPPAVIPGPVPETDTVGRVLDLLDPAARWIAVRLVVRLMVSSRRDATVQLRQGLKQLLAGGLFLQAMRDFPAHALAFGEQAHHELVQARQQMPGMPLPITTLAGVHERMGWARKLAGNPADGFADFRAAVSLWQDAENLTRENAGSGYQAKLAVLTDRRIKAQLQCGDPAQRRAALAELGSVSSPPELRGNRTWLYNRSCLYAQAGAADPRAHYQQQALYWLGLALTRDRNDSLWDYAARDPELEPVRPRIGPFITHLRGLMPGGAAQCGETDAERLVTQALESTFGPG
jgi:hypothetical protein